MPKKQLRPSPVPAWLKNVDASTEFNRTDVLKDSVYYPGSDIDGTPLQAYGGFAHSFVYVDYYCDKETVVNNLPRIGGYEPIFIKDISSGELSSNPRFEVEFKNTDFYGALPHQSVRELIKSTKYGSNKRVVPYCVWSVLQRKSSTNPSHGPERFSLLFIFGEGVATYASIYNSNNLCPLAIIIKSADIGFGRNWTLFEKRGAIFERVVMANPAGIPRYLFTWNRYDPIGLEGREMYQNEDMYWEKYTKKIQNKGYLSIWTTEDAIN